MSISKKLNAKESLLCAAASGSEPDKVVAWYKMVGDDASWEVAKNNQVVTHLAHILLDKLPANSISARWKVAHDEVNRRISAYMSELDRVASELTTVGIPLVALKNAGITRGIYPCAGCSPMGDIDVLVSKRDFRRAHQVMLMNGYHFEFRSPLEDAELEEAEKGGGVEYWTILPSGEKLWFELQWRPVAGRWIRPDQEPSAEELMARSVSIAGSAVRLLAPEDNLLQVALHTAKHTYVRAPGFRLHTDVDRIARWQTINWQLFTERVIKLQVKTAVYFSLAIPKMIFGTPIPDEVLRRIRPTHWKERLILGWLQRAGIFNPDEQKFSSLGYIAFTSLLYDDLSGLRRALFPDSEWMHERYGFSNKLLLPYYHVRRMANLAFKRVLS